MCEPLDLAKIQWCVDTTYNIPYDHRDFRIWRDRERELDWAYKIKYSDWVLSRFFCRLVHRSRIFVRFPAGVLFKHQTWNSRMPKLINIVLDSQRLFIYHWTEAKDFILFYVLFQ